VRSTHSGIRIAGVLGLGFLRDGSSIALIEEILTQNSPDEGGAACLALSTIGSQRALELLGTVLLSGEEKIKVLAALALSCNHPDGHEILKEGSRMKDFLVRRAVVYGLARISEPWAKEIIEKLAIDDDQWLVRDIASQALHYLNNQMSDPLRALPELAESAWLIEFASSKGLGVSPGKPAIQMLYAVLREGSPRQKRFALDYLRLNGEQESLPRIIDCMESADDLTREVAFDVLWHNLAMGLKYPLQN
jgi:HEAT repeat protein